MIWWYFYVFLEDSKLRSKRIRVNTRYNFYDMKHAVKDFQISTPPQLTNWWTTLGWCAKAVDSVADRLVFREFDNDNFEINEIFQMNNADTFFDSAILSATISSCCFVYISKDEDGFPRLEVIDGANATGIIDSTTGLLEEGYAILERDPKTKEPIVEAHFMAGLTRIYENGEVREIPNEVAHPLLVPIIFRPDAKRPFGHSRISRACMGIVAGAMRTIKRSEISAEFFSFPQKYVVGTSPEADPLEKWRATGIVDIVSGKDEFDQIAYMLKEPIVNFSQCIIDDTVRENADCQYEAGLSPKIIAGVYDYEDAKKILMFLKDIRIVIAKLNMSQVMEKEQMCIQKKK